MLRERSSAIALFVEDPVCTSFKMYTILILFFLFFYFYFVLQLFTQRDWVKVTVFEITGAPWKNECYCIFPRAPCIKQFRNVECPHTRVLFWFDFPEHPVYSYFEVFSVLILGFLFGFAVTYPKSMCKSNLYFVILGALRRENNIAYFEEQPAHSSFKMYFVLIRFCYFDFPPFTQKTSVKVIFIWNLDSLRKEQRYCIFCGAPSIQQL